MLTTMRREKLFAANIRRLQANSTDRRVPNLREFVHATHSHSQKPLASDNYAISNFKPPDHPSRHLLLGAGQGALMKIGLPKEIKSDEHRVAMLPVGVDLLTKAGHKVLVEADAGVGSGFSDSDYIAAGATIVKSHADAFDAEMIVKVKEPQAIERARLREGQLLFTYLHLAPDPDQTHDLLNSGVTAIAYETVTDDRGGLPLLAPMSEVAGRLAPQVGGVDAAKGQWRPRCAAGWRSRCVAGARAGDRRRCRRHPCRQDRRRHGADVTVLDRSINRLRYLDDVFGGTFKSAYSDAATTMELARHADMIIGAVLIPGAAAPKLISKAQLSELKHGAALVDVAIDQGGCFETSRATTHQDPIYEVDGVMHYCVANMPGAVARTSTIALCNATLPYALKIATIGYEKAAAQDAGFAEGINVSEGRVTYAAVAETFKLPFDALKA
jgi:alanine dehydrogenase